MSNTFVSMMAEESTHLPAVKAQYEEFVYPPRNPDDERRRLVVSHTHWLPLITHYCFGGRRDLREGGRILIAGCGTGDAEIYLGQQLAGSSAEIVAVDLSLSSIEVARRRAEVRGLTNIRWIQASILDLPDLNIGSFDYIACTGVLHHLEDAGAGLAVLRSLLSPGGAVGVMVYGTYGRTGVYQMQELLRRICGDEPDPNVRLHLARTLLTALPATNWFARGMDLVHDHVNMGDAGLFDLLLHSRDVSFSVPDVHDLVEGAGLQLISFLHQKPLYDHRVMIPDAVVADAVSALPRREQQGVAEQLSGAITRHFFYCGSDNPHIAFDDHDLTPCYYGRADIRAVVRRLRNNNIAVAIGPSGLRQQIRVRNKLTVSVFSGVAEEKSIGEIVTDVVDSTGVDPDAVLAEIDYWSRVLGYGDQLLLRHHSMEKFPPMEKKMMGSAS